MVKFEAKNLVRVSKKLEGLEDRMKNPAIAFKRISVEGWKDVLDHFRKEEDQDGEKWAKLQGKKQKDEKGLIRKKPKKKKFAKLKGLIRKKPKKKPIGKGIKRKTRSKGKILQDTGRLRASIRHKVIKNEAIVFTVVEYAKAHQEGIGVPQRSFMGLSKTALEKATELIKKYVLELK